MALWYATESSFLYIVIFTFCYSCVCVGVRVCNRTPDRHTKQAVILKNKILWLCYFDIAKNKVEYWIWNRWSVWKQQLRKVEICCEDDWIAEDTAYNLTLSQTHWILLWMYLFYEEELQKEVSKYFRSHCAWSLQSCVVFDCRSLALRFGLREPTVPLPTYLNGVVVVLNQEQRHLITPVYCVLMFWNGLFPLW